MIKRKIEELIKYHLNDNKAIILLGARQTGKTTIVKDISKKLNDSLWLNADLIEVQALFENFTISKINTFLSKNKYIFIDEAQRIDNIGMKIKIIIDEFPDKKVIATGSSSFELANKTNEPLTGRKWEYKLYPLSFRELSDNSSVLNEINMLKTRLIFGCYPEVVLSVGREKEVLNQLAESYLYKDLLRWEGLKKPEKIIKLLQALSFQIGNEVSYNELGKIVGLDNETIEKYIQLLEQTFIIFRLGSFSRNLRSELKRSKKIYFYDNGLRNALIANFSTLELRSDIGALWENYMMSERIKYLSNNNEIANKYFWRTHFQQEIDYVEESDGKIFAYEFKWNSAQKAKMSKSFADAYPNTQYKIITPDNYFEFL